MVPELACVRTSVCVRASVCAGMRVRLPFSPSFRVMMESMLVRSGEDLGVLSLRHGECKWADDGDDDDVKMHCDCWLK